MAHSATVSLPVLWSIYMAGVGQGVFLFVRGRSYLRMNAVSIVATLVHP